MIQTWNRLRRTLVIWYKLTYSFCIVLTLIKKDPKDGNWWLGLGKQNELIGFWPKQIFTGLATSATYVAVGGEAYSPTDQPLPPMGNGYYPVMNPYLSAYCCGLTLWDEHYFPDSDPQDLESYSNNWHYNAYDFGSSYRSWGHITFYGGPTLQIWYLKFVKSINKFKCFKGFKIRTFIHYNEMFWNFMTSIITSVKTLFPLIIYITYNIIQYDYELEKLVL